MNIKNGLYSVKGGYKLPIWLLNYPGPPTLRILVLRVVEISTELKLLPKIEMFLVKSLLKCASR